MRNGSDPGPSRAAILTAVSACLDTSEPLTFAPIVREHLPLDEPAVRLVVAVRADGLADIVICRRDQTSTIAVRPSPIHGRGLFAIRPLPKGTLVGVFGGPVMPERDEYSVPVDGMHIDVMGPLRYMNHAREPNCEVADQLRVYVTRDVEANDELVIDYRALGEGEPS